MSKLSLLSFSREHVVNVLKRYIDGRALREGRMV